jgi:hypothetical protein
MAHFLTSGDKFRDLIYDNDHRSYRRELGHSPGDYRFGRTHVKRVRVRRALSRVNGYLRRIVGAIANSKLRRMERELELRGVRCDRSDDNR